MSVVGMTKGIKLSPLRCLLYEFPKLSTLKLHYSILHYRKKAEPYYRKISALPSHSADSKSSHSP